MPNVLRSAGVTTFSFSVSLITMWILRVGLGYIFAIPFGFGVYGLLIGMGIEWAVRTLIFYTISIRVWLSKDAIKEKLT